MKILVVSPFTTHPPDNGGKIRIFNINKNVSAKAGVRQFSLNIFRVKGKIPPAKWTNRWGAYVEYCYSPYVLLLYTFFMSILKIPAYTFVDRVLWMFPLRRLKQLMKECDVIQVHQPWLFRLIHGLNKSHKPLIYFSHNVEYLIVKDVKHESAKSPFWKAVKKATFDLERFACEKCDVMVSVSSKDTDDFVKIYNADRKKIVHVVGGVDTSVVTVPTTAEKRALKKKLGYEGKKIVLFIGGRHYANIDAVRFIEEFAPKYTDNDVVFLSVGTVASGFKNRGNMVFVPDSDIKRFFKIADVAINPMRVGSGSDVKVLEYFGHGIPTVSTSFGLRGFEVSDQALVAENGAAFCSQIRKILKNSALSKRLSVKSRQLIERKYGWQSNAQAMMGLYKKWT